ncbi:MucR family transcriptional regulator [Sphingomonas sp. NIBR02145]|uniref:MucR family transcriptional regulator n=1 Tax=Sphingomonas sp. NIBR02145 TaxID=3014784 RepID=UPI0022B5249D|nr:MucR family transcriptional regulator [Sphingomonas sp. NIBR02145]WHU02590.1 MucR family transcriptional regulator [Sphingomonas sp. NIBR02145]
MTDDSSLSSVELAAELTAAWLANPNTRSTTEDAVAFLTSIHAAVAELGKVAAVEPEPAAPAEQEHVPAVSVRKSLASKEHIISLIDGRPYRTLTRHLSTHGLTPDEYRARYNLPKTYPMTAPAYSEQRREMAKKLGLGRKPGQKAPAKRSTAK